MLYLILRFISIPLFFIGRYMESFDFRKLFRNTKSTKKSKFDASTQLKYEPIAYEQFALVCNRLKDRLIETGNASQTVSSLEKIECMIKRVLNRADKSCCGHVKANGYFSLVKLVFRYLECFDSDLAANKRPRQELLKNIDTFLDLIGAMLKVMSQLMEDTNLEDEQKRLELDEELLKYPEFHRNLKFFRQIMVTKQSSDDNLINNNSINGHINNNINNNYDTIVCKNSFSTTAINQEFNSLPLITAKISTTCDGTYEAIAQPNTRHKEIVFREYFMCWLDTGLVKFFKIFTLSLVFLKNRIYRYPHLILSSRARAKNLNKILRLDIVFFVI